MIGDEMRHFIHYHKYTDAMKRIKEAPEVPIARYDDGTYMMGNIGSSKFDKIGSDKPFPAELAGNTVWGVSRNQGQWYITNRLNVTWVGPREDIPEDVTTATIGEMQYYATCPSDSAWYYQMGACGAVGDLNLPTFGKTLNELSMIQLSGLFAEIDPASFVFYPESSEDEVPHESDICELDFLACCINCGAPIHVDSIGCDNAQHGCGVDHPFDPQPNWEPGCGWNFIEE
jgi:hypothetical protein